MKPASWIILALILALGVAVYDGCRIRDKASIAIGKYQEAIEQAKKLDAEKDKAIVNQQAIIVLKDKLISESVQEITVINTAIGAKDSAIAGLKDKLKVLEAAGDLSGQVANLQEQVRVWAEKFSLAESIIAEKDKIIADWAAKFTAQVEISEAWKAKYESEAHLRTLAESGWKLSERKLKRTKIMSNVKTGLVVGALGYFTFSAIKGK